jgi:spermidine synthase
MDAVEIDGELLDIGHEYFALPRRPQLRLHVADARPFLRSTDERFDAIFVDAYRQPYIPFYLTTREFFALCRERLRPGGVVAINIGHPEGSQRLEKVLAATLGTSFAHLARDPVTPTNVLLLGSEQSITREKLLDAAPSLPAEVANLARKAAARLGPALPGGSVYTDDHAPVEWLIDESLVAYAAGSG